MFAIIDAQIFLWGSKLVSALMMVLFYFLLLFFKQQNEVGETSFFSGHLQNALSPYHIVYV